MNREQLFALHAEVCAKGLEIMKAKNQDYAGASGSSPFQNFERSEVLGIPRELGLMLRVMDKFCRIKSFIESGTLAVKGEPVDDAIVDIINYMILLQGMIEEKRGAVTPDVSAFLDSLLSPATCPVCRMTFDAAHFCAGPHPKTLGQQTLEYGVPVRTVDYTPTDSEAIRASHH